MSHGGGLMRHTPESGKHPEVIKNSAAIHVQNKITLLQRCAWNVLLYHAYDELPTHEEHHIALSELIAQLEFDSKNTDYLKEALKALTRCAVEWNVIGKDRVEQWGVTTLLAQAIIEHGICIYAYSPELRRRLHNPRMYARINLSMQNKFSSRHALALWELCVDYLDELRGEGETPYMPLERFRQLMGIDAGQYRQFREFNRRVVQGPVEEINKVTDFRVEVEYQRQKRKVTAIKLKVQRVFDLPMQDGCQGSLFPDIEDMPTVVQALKQAGLSASDAWDIWQKQWTCVDADKQPADTGRDPEATFTQYVLEKIHLLKQRQQAGKVASPNGFLLEAIRHHYANPAFAQAARERTEASRAKLIQQHAEAVHARCQELLEAEPSLYEAALAWLRQDQAKAIRFVDEPELSAAENYRRHMAIQQLVDSWLEASFPERFATIRREHEAQLAKLEA